MTLYFGCVVFNWANKSYWLTELCWCAARISLGLTHCDRVFLFLLSVSFFRGSLVTRWEAPGGFGAPSGLWLANFSFSTLMLLVGSIDLQNCLPDNLYCVGGDVKPCSIQSAARITSHKHNQCSDADCWETQQCRLSTSFQQISSNYLALMRGSPYSTVSEATQTPTRLPQYMTSYHRHEQHYIKLVLTVLRTSSCTRHLDVSKTQNGETVCTYPVICR